MSNGEASGIPILSQVIAVLQGLLGVPGNVQGQIDGLDKAANSEWANQINVTSFAYGLFGGIRDALGAIVHKIGAALAHVIHDILHGHLLHLLQDIITLLHKFRDLIAPLIKWLQQLQKIQRQYQLQTLKRAIDLIQRIRKVLVVFRLFHLKFAQKLDQWLLNIEGKLIGGTFNIARKTNLIIGWMNIFGTAGGMLQGVPLWGSIQRDIIAFTQGVDAAGLKKLFPAQLNQTFSSPARSKGGPAPQIHP